MAPTLFRPTANVVSRISQSACFLLIVLLVGASTIQSWRDSKLGNQGTARTLPQIYYRQPRTDASTDAMNILNQHETNLFLQLELCHIDKA